MVGFLSKLACSRTMNTLDLQHPLGLQLSCDFTCCATFSTPEALLSRCQVPDRGQPHELWELLRVRKTAHPSHWLTEGLSFWQEQLRGTLVSKELNLQKQRSSSAPTMTCRPVKVLLSNDSLLESTVSSHLEGVS